VGLERHLFCIEDAFDLSHNLAQAHMLTHAVLLNACRTTRVGLERHLFCIEDPFELSHDLGRTVHTEGCDKLRHEFRRAWDVLRHAASAQQALQELLVEAPAPPAPPAAAGAGAGQQSGTPKGRAAAAAAVRDGQQPGTPGGGAGEAVLAALGLGDSFGNGV
jgi:hypothetical protein